MKWLRIFLWLAWGRARNAVKDAWEETWRLRLWDPPLPDENLGRLEDRLLGIVANIRAGRYHDADWKLLCPVVRVGSKNGWVINDLAGVEILHVVLELELEE